MQECIESLQKKFPGVNYKFLQLDLSSQAAVRKAAAELLSWNDITSIDLVINSAAVAFLPEKHMAVDGIELQFATNHVGHYLFTCLIMPKIIEASKKNPAGATRIINITSLSPTSAKMRWSDTNFNVVNKDLPETEQPNYQLLKAWGIQEPEEKSYIGLEAYNQGKVANLLFSVALNKRLFEKHGILSFAAHPGVLDTELGRGMDAASLEAVAKLRASGHYKSKTLDGGSATGLVAGLDPKLGFPRNSEDPKSDNYGSYLIDCQVSPAATPLAVSSSEAEKLWGISEDLVKENFAW